MKAAQYSNLMVEFWVNRATRVEDIETDKQQLLSVTSLLNLLCGAGNFSKILSPCGQHETLEII